MQYNGLIYNNYGGTLYRVGKLLVVEVNTYVIKSRRGTFIYSI